MPTNPPMFNFITTNAFGNLTFTDPVAITTPPGETNRLFIVEQRGRIAVITNLASPNRTVFLDITNRVLGGVPNNEQGLLGLAFHPNYASNRLFYVFYCVTSTSPGVATNLPHNRLSQFQTLAGNPNLADTNSEVVLINQYDQAANHNAGDLHFGPDRYLYVSLGDEGGGNDQWTNSQIIDRDYFAGMLRIDVDKRPGNLEPNPHPSVIKNLGGVANYSVPFDNPFIGATQFNGTNINPANVRTEFWAVGLRNPWRFSFDPATGTLYCGDVGQGAREEIDIITKGGNYGWAFREGFIARPGSPTPPAGFTHINPILDYGRGTGTNQGASVTGGLVYRGTKISQAYGAYFFADYISSNLWMTFPNGTNVVSSQWLTRNYRAAGFGRDPRNGDVLIADQHIDTVRRVVLGTTQTSGAALPSTLHGTGIFSDTSTLTPNPGVIPYDVNVPSWSDNANMTRWFSVPKTNHAIVFNRTNNWQFPTGTVWIQHFELELTNGVPSSAKRLETRLLVKNSGGVYGATYRWNSATNATLVGEEGFDESFAINDGGILRTQVWRYPSRSECLACHTSAGGFALGFNTAQLNRDFDYGGITDNQIRALNHVGYFSSAVTNQHTLPALVHATNSAVSTEYRVRSYLAANCASCHQPGGPSIGTWDARISNPLSASGIINGTLVNHLGNTNNRVVVPNDEAHSGLLARISTAGFLKMPPHGSSLPDTQAIELLRNWITNDLVNYQTYAQWQLANFGSTNAPLTAQNEDFDGDGSLNLQEHLLGTNPTNAMDFWKIFAGQTNGSVEIRFDQIANRGFEVQVATNLQPVIWNPLNVPANRPLFSTTNFPASVPDVIEGDSKYYRVRVFEP